VPSNRAGARSNNGADGRGAGVTCASVAAALPGIVEGLAVADLELRRHVETCLRCQAELAQYRKLLKALHSLRTQVLEPAPGMLPDILAALEAAGERRAMRHLLSGRRAAYVGGIAAATAAGAAGAIVLATRHRHRNRLRLAS
jgi:anti-sigma factor RsiW